MDIATMELGFEARWEEGAEPPFNLVGMPLLRVPR